MSRDLSVVRILLLLLVVSVVPAQGQVMVQGGQVAINQVTAGNQDFAAIDVSSDGVFAVLWESADQDGSADNVYLRRFGADGVALGDQMRVNVETDDDQHDPDVAFLSDGRLVVVWDSDQQDGSQRGVYGRLFDTAGAPVTGEFLVNQVTDGDQNDPVVAAGLNGGFLVAWETNPVANPAENVAARLFDSTATAVADQFLVNITLTGDQEDIDVASDGAGNFVLVWESDDQDSSPDSIVARRVDASGALQGGEIAVNATSAGIHFDPALVVQPDGRFLVVWEELPPTPGPSAVVGRLFAADGTAMTSDLRIDDGQGSAELPGAAGGPSGDFLVAWHDDFLDSGELTIVGRHVTAEGILRGAVERLSPEVAGDQAVARPIVGTDGRGFTVWETDTGTAINSLDLFGRRVELPIFFDGFESGDVSAWSAVVP
ncbi:MAG: hypothetical protein AAF604_04015 [Acidobacteriota bacterium]